MKTSIIQRALLKIKILSVVYLDDLLIICKKNQDPAKQFSEVLAMVRRLGLPVAWEKVVGPARTVRFLGIIIDTDNREIRMPQDKIEKFLTLIEDVYNKRSISKRTMQSVLGHVNHIGKGVPSARLFINRMLASLRGAQGRYITVDAELRKDLEWFRKFLSKYNGRTLIVGDEPTVIIEADSCLTGGGGRMGDLCYAFEYPTSIASTMHISQMEALNCVVAARVFLEDSCNLCAQIVCDNEGAVASLSSGRARDMVLGAMCRAFWYFSASRNIRFKFVHRPGAEMVVADALSRRHLGPNDLSKAKAIIEGLNLRSIRVEPRHYDFDLFL